MTNQDQVNFFKEIFNHAYAAGVSAADAAQVDTMRVIETDVLGRTLPGAVPSAPFEPCGFAWVNIKGTTAFARWVKKEGYFRKAYGPGLQYWVSYGEQSMGRKEAFAEAFAKILRDNGIEASTGSRMD
jgi:hypothetical protein